MAKIEIVLADRDKIYLEHMARYFMEKAKQCEIATFSSKQSLLQFLSSHGPIDILLIEPELICEELETFPIAAKIILTVAEEEHADYEADKDGGFLFASRRKWEDHACIIYSSGMCGSRIPDILSESGESRFYDFDFR